MIALGAILAVALVLRLIAPDLAYFNLHVGRDLYRALQLLTLDEIPLLGSEMQYGGRVLGPFVYVIYAIPLAVAKTPVAVGIFIGLLNTGVIAATWWFGRRWFGPQAALVAAAIYTTFPLEIVQLRYLWNPCFFPAMILGMQICLFRFCLGKSQWDFLGAVFFFVLALQLHFSVLMMLPALAIGLWLCRAAPRLKVLAVSLAVVALLFTPMLVNEVLHERGNIREIIAAEEARAGLLERHRPNPNALRNMLHVVTFDWNENAYRLGFTYLWWSKDNWREQAGPYFFAIQSVALTLGLLQLLAWGTGVMLCLRRVFSHASGKPLPETPQCGAALLLLLWQFAPVPLLFFFNYHRSMDGGPALIPIRYFLVTFPAQFLLAGIGVAWWMQRERLRFRRAPILSIILLGMLMAGHIAFAASHLRLWAATGQSLPYIHYRAPTLRTMLDTREVLLDRFSISADDYYERVITQNVFRPGTGEVTLDWLITQDPRSVSNPGLPPGESILIWSPPYEGLPGMGTPPESAQIPILPEGAEILEELERAPLLFIRFLGEPDPDESALDPTMKRNFYYREVRMKYLGPPVAQ